MINIEYFRKQLEDIDNFPVRVYYIISTKDEKGKEQIDVKSIIVDPENGNNIDKSNLKFLGYNGILQSDDPEKGVIPVFEYSES